MVLECVGDLLKLSVDLRESVCHLGDRLRCSYTSYNVLTLSVNEEFSEELAVAVSRVSCKRYACTGIVAAVAEYHGLNVYGCSE